MKLTLHNPVQALRQFHTAFDEPKFLERDAAGRDKMILMRIKLILEEAAEAVEALIEGDFNHIAKELADLLVVTYGTADLLEIPIAEAFAEVHRSNMTKLGLDGRPLRRDDGKILKGPNYEDADIERVLREV